MSSDSQLDLMYKSFAMFADASAARCGGVKQISAGANWVRSCPSVIQLLHQELDAGPTLWNYGRSAGPLPVTDALEFVEYELSGRRLRPAVTLVNGTAEGAHLVLHQLAADGRAPRGSAALMIGHGFPLYSHLCGTLGLEFREVLNEDGCDPGYLPTMERVVKTIRRERPNVVFLLVPNNPIGESYPEEALGQLADACGETGAMLLVDRVCLLPWDDPLPVCRAIAPLLENDQCFVVDSVSKAESLAGIRVGFVVSSVADRELLLQRTRERCLNPVTFSTVTLAFCRLASLPPNVIGAEVKAAELVGGLNRERPGWADESNFNDVFPAFRDEYQRELVDRKLVLYENHRMLRRRLGHAATRPLAMDAGFNVALTLPVMHAGAEENDQWRLAYEHGVGVLTEACFRRSKRITGNYFMRLGLSLPCEEFAQSLEALCTYFEV